MYPGIPLPLEDPQGAAAQQAGEAPAGATPLPLEDPQGAAAQQAGEAPAGATPLPLEDPQRVAEAVATQNEPKPSGREFLTPLAERLSHARSLRPGTILLRFADGQSVHIECSPTGVRIVEEAWTGEQPPLLEVMGDAERLRAIVDGKKDAVSEFLAGGLRVRGDLGYLSDLGMELGFLRRPL